MKYTKYSTKIITQKAENRDYSKHLCLPPFLPRELSVIGTVLFWLVTLKVPPWWSRKDCKNFLLSNPLDCWKTHFQSTKH